MRVLLVEDNADHQELMSLALTGHDPIWQVDGVASGEEALCRLAEEPYDLVFLDYSLPRRDGLEVLQEIRRGVSPPPVVMVTGRGDEQIAVGAMKTGAYDYVVKGESYLQRLPVVARLAVEAYELALERKRAEEELRQRQEKLMELNRELEASNHGLLALYTEMDERAEQLRHATEWKSRVLGYMGHELRGPLGSILSLGRILLNRSDGNLTAEQEKQVTLIRASAHTMLEITNDLLDSARFEAGKIPVHPSDFEVADLFRILRGMVRPFDVSPAVELVFEEPTGIPRIHTDEGKVTQILRNLISNAFKFTDQGEVRVSAKLDDTGQAVVLCVADTGIGIAPEDQERIFEEFVQLKSPVQQRVRGVGLGLALSRRLAQLLGGSLSVESEPAMGSTFTVVIPLLYAEKVPTIDGRN